MNSPQAAITQRALLIGIEDYPGLPKLHGCINDARLMQAILRDTFGFPAENITLLENEAATRDAILAAFDALIAATNHDDVVVITYAGHGSQMTDLEGDEPTGLDSTIMPYDSEGWQGKNRDITDDEIGLKLQALGERTSCITLIFDSCHSGTITRDAMGTGGRSVPADTRAPAALGRSPVPGVLPDSGATGPSGWMPVTEKYVVISGCRDEETSFEYNPPEGAGEVTHGALTYFLAQQLKQVTPTTTYRDIFERAAGLVNAVHSAQHPQMEGKSNRVIFGMRELVPQKFVRVTKRDGDAVTLAAGVAQGATVGSVYSVYPQGTKTPEGLTALGEVEITEVSVVSAQAKVLSEAVAASIGADSRAFETKHAYGDFRLAVALDATGSDADALQALLDKSTLLKVVADDASPSIRIQLLPKRDAAAPGDPVERAGALLEPMWAATGESGDLVMPLKRAADAATVRDNLETLARYRQALALENPDPQSKLRGKFTLDLLKKDATGAWVAAEPETAGGTIVYTEGDAIGFKVASTHDAEVFIALVDFGLTGSVNPLRPPQGAPASQEKLGPGNHYTIGPEMKQAPTVGWSAGFPFIDNVDHSREAEAIETVKLFITEQLADFSVIQQAGVRGEGRKSSPIGDLLHRTFHGAPTRDIVMAPPAEEIKDDWTTVSRSFVVRRRTSAPLNDSGTALNIGNATLSTKGMSGTVSAFLGKPAREEAAKLVGDSLSAALADSGIDVKQTIAITGAAETGPVSRGAGDAPTMQLTLADPGPGFGQLVMSADELGVVSWHFAPPQDGSGMRGGISTGPAKRSYDIPRGIPTEPPSGNASRGVIGVLGNKFLKEMIFPLIDPIIGEVSATFVNRMEQHRWPYRVRAFGPGDYAGDSAPALDAAGWSRMSGGRALLMVHGTFSRSHLAFGALPKEYVEQLHQMYGGRVFAFDHFTLSHDPKENVRRLLAQIPEGTSLDLDIICHSRGGLVSRILSEKQGELSMGKRQFKVGKVVFVGAPNAGTGLADPKHLSDVIDVFTNLLSFVPSAGVTDTLTMIMGVIKQLAVGAMKGLDGLESMKPDGEFAKWINAGARAGDTRYYALAANVTPKDPGLKHFVMARGLNKLINGDNDLVVPTAGVWDTNGSGFFPIADKLVLEGDEAVSHTKFFADPTARKQILEWLGA
ncbi:MAG: caspase family protein [Gemmatimonadota bacterium]